MRPRHAYVHVPFCARRCSYCDFAIAVRRAVPVDEYLRALERELALRYPPGEPWALDTLYLGGGTPSLLGGAGVARAIGLVRRHATLAAECEVTLEANPDDVTAEAVARWRDAGVNRLSIGSQSFSPNALAWMHRTHEAAQIARAAATARAGGIGTLSLDLIFGLPGAVNRSWERDVADALALEPAHLSLYGLTIEPSTPLARRGARGECVEAPEERYAEEYLLAHDLLTTAGLEHYEVSNFARPGHSSRHNASYWSGASYAGLGPSAHEFDGARRRWNEREYAAWVSRLAGGHDPVAGGETLTAANREAEGVYLGLRTDAGLVLEAGEAARTAAWREAGWATLDGGRLRLTQHGWLRLDALAADLAAFRANSRAPALSG